MDFQGREIAEATVISGDYRLSRVHFEKFVYGFGEVGVDYFTLDYFYRTGPRVSATSICRWF